MATIKPTIGRVVLYWPDKEFRGCRPDACQPLPALIARVWSDTSINVGGFDANGMPFSATSVYLTPAEGEPPNMASHYATWMPYQKGQAAKYEALEKQLETKTYPDGVTATGVAPLPDKSPLAGESNVA